ncbi:RNA polymerase sigma factor [Muriicola soli]|uniref:RNA polymerase sigma factor n=1 Tax=Muriicola soli TaxID=2507538 RepID=A0A411ECG1_9FLAO|nr:RNA polymerase sigma factor [Muriicola soli]MBT8281424.1 RNA polymerase sigma factor [Muriicola sp.]NNK11170.1 RNA polymerase sigma factor [Flavobacteriaceae bacterium]QBA65445.1 RNA polymerase sigma factor [Muriicola soli]
MSLKKLIHQCKKGDRKAQEQLYRKYSSVLYGLCLKYSRNKTEAEDNLHDSFLTIYDKIEQFKFKGSFEGWLKRITVNTVLQKYRKDQYMKVVTDNIQEEEDIDYDYPDVQLSTLLQYVQELPNKYRLTFNLYVLDGYTHKEISELLGTSTGTSKSNLSRAKMILKEKLKKENINIA